MTDRGKMKEIKEDSKMTKQVTPLPNIPNNLTPEQLDDDFKRMIAGDMGKGTSQRPEDNTVPLVYILQGLSPQINKRNDDYIEGAEVGDIWLRHAPSPIIKGDEGILFLPCHFWKDYVEWIPRDAGGGFAGRHHDLPREAVEVPGSRSHKMPNGNDLVRTANHAGYVLLPNLRPLPYVIPMKSTGLKVSGDWMMMMNNKRDDKGKVYPSYLYKYRLTTKHRKNKEGEWYIFDVADAGCLSKDERQLYKDGQNLELAFQSGEKTAEEELVHREDQDAPL